MDFSALFEREQLAGRTFSEFGRYSTRLLACSDLPFEVLGNRCFFSVGYGCVSYAGLAKPGVLGNFLQIGLGAEYRISGPEEILYRRAPETGGEGGEAEGETVW